MPEPEIESIAKFATLLAELNGEDSLTARLCEASRRMLEADGVAMTLNYLLESRLTVYAGGDLSATLDDLQDVVGEGPGFEAAQTDSVVVGQFGEHDDGRWPLLRERLMQLGFNGTVLAIPLDTSHVAEVGVLTLHRLARQIEDLSSARFLGATVGAALLDDPEHGVPQQVFADAWESRVLVHQATGMIVAQVGVRPDDAIALLRGQAFARGLSLTDVAGEIIDRRINFRHFEIEGD
jgi:hypothetical protein